MKYKIGLYRDTTHIIPCQNLEKTEYSVVDETFLGIVHM